MDVPAKLAGAKDILSQLQDSENINDLLSEAESRMIGLKAKEMYDNDVMSRVRWDTQMKAANDLALQIAEPKTYPFESASNVKFPLITVAAMQFQARAYPALVKVPDLVKFRVQGKDDDGAKAGRSQRISRHMSYQFLEEDEDWEEHHDRLLLAVPIFGCAFKKSYYDKTKGHNCSTLVLPKNLVVNYFAKSIDQCEVKTERLEMSPRLIRERQLSGVFSDIELGPHPHPATREEDKRQGLVPPIGEGDRLLLEQHCYLDLDGDKYKEPYIVTIDESTSKVLRIKSRWDEVKTEQSVKIHELQKRIKAFAEGIQQPEAPTQEDLAKVQQAEQVIIGMQAEVDRLSKEKPKVLRIKTEEHYTKYGFIPAPDGGFYDLGLGALLGPLNSSVNTLVNQLIDAGHMSSGAVGFIGKGARIKGGQVRFRPYEFMKVNATGGSIRDSIVQLNIGAPSPVLFQLLSLLISYAERIGSVTDAMVGENPGQNTPAYNMSAMLEQGLQVFNGVFKRIYRSMRSEFRKHYHLNRKYMDRESYFSYQDEDERVLRTDYTGDDKDLIPAADPNAFSSKEKTQKALALAERSMMVPGYDPIVVEKAWLEAMEVSNPDELYPLTQDEGGNVVLKFPPQPNPEFEIQREDLARKTLEGQSRHDLQVQEVEIKYMLAESDIAEKISKAEERKDKTLIDRLKLQQAELQSKREALAMVAVAEIGANAKQRTDK